MDVGLEFQKAESNCMRFMFTQIDPKYIFVSPLIINDSELFFFCCSAPSKVFYFSLRVNEQDMYSLTSVSEPLDQELCDILVENLNGDNNIGRYANQN